MRAASAERLRGHHEALLAMANTGAGSLYWLGLAFAMSASEYGYMMTVQAAVGLVAAAFNLRTHDLVYFLTSKRNLPLERAYRIARTVETGAAATATAVIAAGAVLWFGPARPASATTAVILLGFATSIAAMQGSTAAKLRQLGRSDLIGWAELVCVGAWAAVIAAAIAARAQSPLAMLVLGSIPLVARTLILLAAARVRGTDEVRVAPSAPADERRVIVRFLAGGQFMNIAKNGATSLETMIVAAFFSAPVVAMFRLAKASLAGANAASNVALQRGFAQLGRAADGAGKRAVWRQMQRRALWLCLALYPVSAGVALAYALNKPEIAVIEFQLITLGAFAAFVPAVLLQAPFAIITLDGRQTITNLAYVFSTALFGALCALLFVLPSIWLFIAALVIAGFARYRYLAHHAGRLLATPPSPQPTSISQ